MPIIADLTIPAGTTLHITSSGGVINGADLVNQGTILVEGAFLAVFSSSTLSSTFSISSSGVLTNHGLTSVDGGTFTNSGTINNGAPGVIAENVGIGIAAGGTLHNTGTGVFENYAMLALQGTITNDGTIRNHCGATYMLQGGTFTGNAIEYETCDLNATVCSMLSGTWDAASSTCTVASGTNLVPFDLTVPAGATLHILSGATVGNQNQVDLVNLGTILVEGTLWPTWYGGTFTNSGVLTNYGTVQAEGGTFTNTGTINNGAVGQTDSHFLIESGTFNNTASGAFHNYAWLLNQGTLNNSGTVHHRYYLDNSGTIANSGTIYSYCGAMVTGTGTVSGTPIEYKTCFLNETVCGWLPGAWEAASSTCTITGQPPGIPLNLTIPAGTTLHVASGATFSNIAELVNNGTVHNEGVFSAGAFTNNGLVDNDHDFGVLGGTLTNAGTIVNGSAGQATAHFAVMDIEMPLASTYPGTIDNTAQGVIENYAVLANEGTINNSGVINAYCGATYGGEGAFTGNPIANACNTAPVANNDDCSGKEDTPMSVAAAAGVLANDTDAESNPLTAAKVANPAHGSVTLSANGSFSYTPAANYCGSDSFTYKAYDGALYSNVATVSIAVACVNDAPVLGAIGGKGVNELAALTFTATASDPDSAANTLTFSLVEAPAGASITAGGAFTWTPTEQQGPGDYTFRVRVCDNGNPTGCNSEEITVTVREVNQAPALGAIGNKSLAEMTALTFTATATDPDYPDNVLSFSLVGAPSGASITERGSFSWTPAEAQGAGTYTFAVKVCDHVTPVLCDEETITVSVTEVNRAPVLDAIGDKTVDEMTALAFTAMATDPDTGTGAANTLTFSLVGAPSGASITAGGAFSWTPTEAQGAGGYPLTVKVCDSGTPALCDEEAITVAVAEVNRAPVIVPISDRSVDEMTALTFTAAASDPDSGTGAANTLSAFSLVAAPAGATITDNGEFSWTPTEAQGPGDYSFKVRICDNGSPALCGEEGLTVTVREVNRAPVLGDISSRSVDEMTALTFTAAATDPDLPANTLTFSLVGAPAGASITAGGAFSWTPAEDQGPGTYPFTVKVCDNGSSPLCDSEAIVVTVYEVNSPPALDPLGDQTATWGNELAFTATASDPDRPANALTFSLVGAPTGASITTGGAFSWTPTSSQIGDHNLTVKVCDNGATRGVADPLCDQEAVTITVQKRPTALVYSGSTSTQYSDSTAVQATLTDHGGGSLQGAPLASKTIGFTLGTQSTSATTDANGLAKGSILLDQPVGALAVASSFVGDALYLGSSDSDLFQLIKEGAEIVYTGDTQVTTARERARATVTLAATLEERQDGSLGDQLAGQQVLFQVFGFGDTTYATPLDGCTAGIGNVANGKGYGSCTVDLPASDPYQVKVSLVANPYYAAQFETVIVLVNDPGTGMAAGGGWLIDPITSGRVNFGLSAKFLKKGRVQGNSLFVYRVTTDLSTILPDAPAGERAYDWIIKSNAMQGLNIYDCENKTTSGCKATITGKNTVQAVDRLTGVLYSIGGNYQFQVDVTDNGEPGSSRVTSPDQYAIRVWNVTGTYYELGNTYDGKGSLLAPLDIEGGNIQVKAKK